MAQRKFSPAQLEYLAARAAYDVAYKASRDNDKLFDAECKRLGLSFPYGQLPEGHPMWETAQALADVEYAALDTMKAAAYRLFNWAIAETFKRHGSAAEKAMVYAMLDKVKEMAHVEKPFIELVEMSMLLDTTLSRAL